MHTRAEVERLAQYLETLRALPASAQPLRVTVISPAAQRAAFERNLVSDTRFAFQFRSLEEAARGLGIRGAPSDMRGEQLALALAIQQPPREQFAGPRDRRSFLQWRLQRALLAIGALGFSACAAYAGVQWLDTLELRDQVRVQRAATQEAKARHQHVAVNFPAATTSTENLKAAVQELRRIAARTAPPEDALRHLARALGECPQIELEALVWGVRPLATPELGVVNRFVQMLEISARVQATSSADYRAVDAQIQRFAAALQAGSAWQTVRAQLPFDATPQGTLSGGDAAPAPGAAARFVIVVQRPLG